jgi:hypothetical protein
MRTPAIIAKESPAVARGAARLVRLEMHYVIERFIDRAQAPSSAQ